MDERDASKDRSRIPTVDDLIRLCQGLQERKARFMIIGGFAVIHHGLIRGTTDIDFLIDKDPKNISKVTEALPILEDQASKEIRTDDFTRYSVVRVAGEIVVDLMSEACGKSFSDLEPYIEEVKMEGISLPYLSVEGLLKTKQGIRPKDVQDRQYLEQLLAKKKKP